MRIQISIARSIAAADSFSASLLVAGGYMVPLAPEAIGR
jgi:hypothetical protein